MIYVVLRSVSPNINVISIALKLQCVYFMHLSQSKEEEYLDLLIEQEQYEASVRKKMITEDEKRERVAKKKHKQALIDDLVSHFTFKLN